jgi:signal transduction histidine kinase
MTQTVSHAKTAPALSVQYCTAIESDLTLSQAKQCNYVSRNELDLAISQGSVIWVRVSAQNQAERQAPISIHVAPYLIKRIEIFNGNTDELLAGPVGMEFAFSEQHGRLGGYSFTLNPAVTLTSIYYARLVTSGLPYAFVTATMLDQASNHQDDLQVGLGIHLGVLGLLLLASAGLYAATRDRIAGCFALVILNLLLATLSGSGWLAEHLWRNSPQFNTFFFNANLYLRVGLWVLLAQAFLAPYKAPDWYRHGCHIVYVIVGVMMLLPLVGLTQLSNWLLLVLGVTLIPAWQIAAIQVTQEIRIAYKRILLAGFALGAVLVWLTLLVTLFRVGSPGISIQFARLVDYVNPLVLLSLVVLHYRETVMQLAETKKENLTMRLGLSFEKKLREERKLLIDMLTHEIKNPLASISLAVGSLAKAFKGDQSQIQRRIENIDQSVRSMDLVIERCNLMNQLDQSTLSAQPEQVDLLEVIETIRNRFPEPQRVIVELNGDKIFFTDAQFFQMIISNLVENALKYSPVDHEVYVSVTRPPNPNLLSITITNKIGPKGAPDPNMVFHRFYRNPLAQDTAGSGVGLCLVYQLVQLLKGQIAYEPSPINVIFKLEIPEANPYA